MNDENTQVGGMGEPLEPLSLDTPENQDQLLLLETQFQPPGTGKLAKFPETLERIRLQPVFFELLREVQRQPEELPFIINTQTKTEAQTLRRKLYMFFADLRYLGGLTEDDFLLDTRGVIPSDLRKLVHMLDSLELKVKDAEIAIVRLEYTPESLAIRGAIEANRRALTDPGLSVTVLRQRLMEIRERKRRGLEG